MELNEYLKLLNDFDSGTIRGHDKDEQLEDAVSRLTGLGWAFPGDLTFEQIEELGSAQNSDEYINDLLESYYSSDNYRQLESLVNITEYPDYYEIYSGILEEIFDSLRSGKYRICIPALMTVLEGVLTSKLGIRNSKNTHMIGPSKAQIDKSKMNLTKTFWRSIQALVATLYCVSDFDDAMPEQLNRHWVLHGRGSIDESKVNCLQLLVLIGAIIAA